MCHDSLLALVRHPGRDRSPLDDLPDFCVNRRPACLGPGLYQSIVRYIGLDLFVAGAMTATGTTIGTAALLYLAELIMAPFRWIIAFGALALIYICGSRFFARKFLLQRKSRRERESVIIYGAGDTASSLAMFLFGSVDFHPVAMNCESRVRTRHHLRRGWSEVSMRRGSLQACASACSSWRCGSNAPPSNGIAAAGLGAVALWLVTYCGCPSAAHN